MSTNQTNEPLAPDVTVRITGTDGNAFAVIGKVSRALKDAGRKDLAAAFMEEAIGGDYSHLLLMVTKYVEAT